MAVNQTLMLRAKLLVAEYGLKRVIAALAQAEGAELEAIEREVDALRKKKPANRRRRRKTLAELLVELKLGAEAHALVKDIGSAYENKRYLGELWRVKRFLASHGVEADKLRSRAAALPVVVGLLCEMPVSELTEIAAESKERAGGDLGIIADQILGAEVDSSSASTAARANAAQEPSGSKAS